MNAVSPIRFDRFVPLVGFHAGARHALADWTPSRRPPRHPGREVPHAHRHAEHLDGERDPARWTLISITSAADGGPVRNPINYKRPYGTSVTFYEKCRRLQVMEGPNEPAVADHLELMPRYLDFQFHPLALKFRRADGRIITKYPDVAVENDRNEVAIGEIKSSGAWFNAPGVKRPLDRISLALETEGLGPLLRIKGEPLRKDRVLQAHIAAMDARLTSFSDDEAAAVRSLFASHGPVIRHGALCALLGGRMSHAEDKLYAMLLRRVVSFELGDKPADDTPVVLPRTARAFALRDLLGRFAPEAI